MSTPFEISDRFVSERVAITPTLATVLGIPGHDDRWPDLSPDGHDAVADLHLRVMREMASHLDDADTDQALAAQVVHGFAAMNVSAHEHGDHLRDLAHIASTFEMFRDIFDMMDPTTAEGIEPIVRRLETIDEPYEGYRSTLSLGIDRGVPAAKRQARSILEQARALGSDASAYHGLVSAAREAGVAAHTLERLERAVDSARAEARRFGDWIETDYLPYASDHDGVGAERYVRHAEEFLGFVIDPIEVYEWGWAEVEALRAEMREVVDQIDPSLTPAATMELLETDPDRAVASVDEFVSFVSSRLDRALDALDGVHFDVPAEIREVTVNIAPAGSPPGAYYIEPSEDFSRPGSVWYSVEHKQTFPLYQEVATAYHEGFPGHHLEVGTTRVKADRLSRAQRTLIWYSGFGEGWALYAERLMDELGFFETPDYRFGMLASQLFRAARVVTDIGLHLGLMIPDGAPMGSGVHWNRDLGAEFMRHVGMQPPADAASEVDRYLGWPGQAISYKVGEREILSIRDAVKARSGADFDLKAFHAELLTGGNMPLSLLRRRMSS